MLRWSISQKMVSSFATVSSWLLIWDYYRLINESPQDKVPVGEFPTPLFLPGDVRHIPSRVKSLHVLVSAVYLLPSTHYTVLCNSEPDKAN